MVPPELVQVMVFPAVPAPVETTNTAMSFSRTPEGTVTVALSTPVVLFMAVAVTKPVCEESARAGASARVPVVAVVVLLLGEEAQASLPNWPTGTGPAESALVIVLRVAPEPEI